MKPHTNLYSKHLNVAAGALLLSGAVQATGISGQGTWETTLLGRDINGHAVSSLSSAAVFLYDTTLKITWLQNASMTDLLTNVEAKTWASDLVVGAFTDWRLPNTAPVNGHTYQMFQSNNGTSDFGSAKTGVGWGTSKELGHLYYVSLGNKGDCTPNDAAPTWLNFCPTLQPGRGLANTGAFSGLRPAGYWSGTPTFGFDWAFQMDSGEPGLYGGGKIYALAVRDGDVLAAVPEPSSYLLMSLGTLALLGFSSKSRRI